MVVIPQKRLPLQPQKETKTTAMLDVQLPSSLQPIKMIKPLRNPNMSEADIYPQLQLQDKLHPVLTKRTLFRFLLIPEEVI